LILLNLGTGKVMNAVEVRSWNVARVSGLGR
jgi:hypothetical protein